MDNDIEIKHKFEYNGNCYTIDYINASDIYNKIKEGQIEVQKNQAKIPVIVSLTSYPRRIGKLYCTLYSIITQSVRPKSIVLWLAEEEFPHHESDLPDSLLLFQKYGLEIKWTHNIISFKKIIYSLKEFGEYAVVTADDDVIYRRNWLELLYKAYLRHPHEICAHRARVFQFKKYNCWGLTSNTSRSSYLNFFTGVGGVLYPPGVFNRNKFFFDEYLMLELCPTADDVWFWAMAVLSKVKIRVIDNNIIDQIYVYPQDELRLGCKATLAVENCENNGNDRYLKNVLERFPQIKRRLIFEILKTRIQKCLFFYERNKSSFRVWILGIPVYSKKKKNGNVITRLLIFKSKRPISMQSQARKD